MAIVTQSLTNLDNSAIDSYYYESLMNLSRKIAMNVPSLAQNRKSQQFEPHLIERDNELDEENVSRVSLKMYRRLCDAWELDDETAANLAQLDVKTWRLMRVGRWVGELNKDQMVRIGLLFQLCDILHILFGEPIADRWATLTNKGPLCGGKTPTEVMLRDGVSAMVIFRDYLNRLAYH